MSDAQKHLDDVATWLRRSVITHIERDHGGVADWEEPWVNHRQIHWRDTSVPSLAPLGGDDSSGGQGKGDADGR